MAAGRSVAQVAFGVNTQLALIINQYIDCGS